MNHQIGTPFRPLIVLVCACLFCSVESVIAEEVPLVSISSGKTDLAESLADGWTLDVAANLLEAGLASSAESAFRRLLASNIDDGDFRLRVSIGLLDALISQGQYVEADRMIGQMDIEQKPRLELRRVLILFALASTEGHLELWDAMEFIDVARLPEADLAWFYYLRASMLYRDRDFVAAKDNLDLAEDLGAHPEQYVFFQSMRLITLSSEAGERDLVALEALAYASAETSYRALALENYILALASSGRSEEAVSILEQARSGDGDLTGFTPQEATRLTLLQSLIVGADSPNGLSLLTDVVNDGSDRLSIEVALHLVVLAVENREELFDFLGTLLDREKPHPFEARVHFLRSQIALFDLNDRAMAEIDAKLLLDEYPGAREVYSAYQLLAYSALQDDPPQYRAAAEYLLQSRKSDGEAGMGGSVDQWIADAYFLNSDYANAADFYRSAFDAEVDVERRGEVFMRFVIASLRAGQVERAVGFVDSFGTYDSVPPISRWRIEWNISQQLMGLGELSRVQSRVERLLGENELVSIPTILDLRFRWLNYYLKSISGDFEGLIEGVSALLERIDAIPSTPESEVELVLLKSETLLLRAEALLLADGMSDEALRVLRGLRESYPYTDAAERTYLAEASYFASIADFRAAQTILVALVDAYPEGRLADFALFQSAQYTQNRGPEHYQEAVLLLARLVEEYPDATIAYEAVLRQGDLLRLSNDFASAQLLYDNLINAFPDHPLRHRAELGRADCIVALAEGNEFELIDAGVALERVLDLPNLSDSLQAEAAHKWGVTLQHRGALNEARDVFSMTVARFFLDSERASNLDRIGQYWVARSVFALGALLESDGEADEARRLYRLMIALNMPGRNISSSRLENLAQ